MSSLVQKQAVNYKEQDFAEWIQEVTQSKGVDVIEDFIGAAYWDKNLRSLKIGGRLIMVGLMGGVKTETNLGLILTKRLQVFGSVLRSRTLADKIEITQRFKQNWLPLLTAGKIKPIIDTVFPLAQAAEAHRYMEDNRNVGKIMLDIP